MTDSPVVDERGAPAPPDDLRRWQVWHTYSTYSRVPIEDIVRAGHRFVDSGLAVAALASSGEAWWTSDAGAITSDLDDTRSAIGISAREMISPYAAECLKTAMRMESARRRVFPGDPGRPSAYVRALLEPMTLRFASGDVVLYPQVLLDSSGVILTEFRTLSPEGGSNLRELIDGHVNLFQHESAAAGIPKGPLRWFIRGLVGPLQGWRSSRRDKDVDAWVQDVTSRFLETPDTRDFAIPVVGISGQEARALRRPQDPPLGLRFLGHVLETATSAAVLSRPEVLGKKNARRYAAEFPFGEAWSGRPSVYLLPTDDEPASARARVDRMADDLAKIMWRTTNAPGGSEALGRNLRAFDDYAAFVNSALYLWVCGRRDSGNAEDPNDDSAVCEKQVQVEHVEALWANHLRLRALADEPKRSVAEMVRIEQELWRLTTYARQNSRYGEIWQFLEYASEQLGIREAKSHLQEGLRLRSAVLDEERNKRQQWFGWVLTVLLGIGASETLSDRFLVPILRGRGFDFTGGTFWVDVASLVILVVAALAVWLLTARRLRV